MGLTELKHEIQPLTIAEKAELIRYLQDLLAQENAEDAADLALFDARITEPTIPFADVLAERERRKVTA
jgi:hypothetical protein